MIGLLFRNIVGSRKILLPTKTANVEKPQFFKPVLSFIDDYNGNEIKSPLDPGIVLSLLSDGVYLKEFFSTQSKC